jgi:hypothetical protein
MLNKSSAQETALHELPVLFCKQWLQLSGGIHDSFAVPLLLKSLYVL